jgi:hypothetical protein
MSTVNKLCLSEVVVPFVSDTRKIALDSMSEAITINECYDLLTYCQKRSEVSDNTGVNLRDYANLLGLTTQAGRRRLSSTQLSQEQFTPPKQQEVGGGERFTVCAIAEDDRIISIGEITKNYKEVKNMIDKNSDEEAVKKDLEKINKGLINNSTEWGKLHGFWVGQINQKLIDLTGKELEDHEKLNNHKKEVHAEEIWIFRFAKDLSNKLDENIDKIKRIEILSTYVSCGETTKNCRIRIIGRIVKLLKKKLKEANRNEDEIEVILFTFKDDEAHRYGLGEQLAYKVLENDNEIDLSLLGEWQDDDQNHGSTSASSSSASASSSSLLSGMEVILKKS